MGRIFPFITVHEYRLGRSLANRCIPISTLVRSKALCSPYPGICCMGGSLHVLGSEEDGTRHVINDFIWEMSIRTISTKVEDVSHKNL